MTKPFKYIVYNQITAIHICHGLTVGLQVQIQNRGLVAGYPHDELYLEMKNGT